MANSASNSELASSSPTHDCAKEFAILTAFRIRLLLSALCCLLPAVAPAEQVRVRHIEGTVHGFIAVHDPDGHLIASGDMSQTVHGDRIVLHLVFEFKDGSLDDETTVFTQHRVFQLISDHHIQRGPFFPHTMDVAIDARSGQVTIRTTGKDGKEQVDQQHMQLPPDLANGLTGIITKNRLPADPPTTVSMLATTPKPRLVKLVFTSRGEDPMTIAGMPRKAMRTDMKIDLGGVAGVVAPLIGKQPPDFTLWTYSLDAPVAVKETGFLYQDGPVLSFDFAAPVWPQSPDAKMVTAK